MGPGHCVFSGKCSVYGGCLNLICHGSVRGEALPSCCAWPSTPKAGEPSITLAHLFNHRLALLARTVYFALFTLSLGQLCSHGSLSLSFSLSPCSFFQMFCPLSLSPSASLPNFSLLCPTRFLSISFVPSCYQPGLRAPLSFVSFGELWVFSPCLSLSLTLS